MKIIVTGSEGNTGKVLVPYLRSCGHTIERLDIVQGWADDYTVCDITNALDMARVFQRFNPDVVYHMAAMVSRVTCERSPAITINTNVHGTNNVAQLCLMYGAKLINFSTSEVYGNIGGLLSEDIVNIAPNNLYGVSKAMAEQLVRYYATISLPVITVRPFMFYHEDETLGGHRSAMVRFCTDLLQGKEVTVHQGSARSWMHLDDGVWVLEKLLYVHGSYTVNIGSPDVISTLGLAQSICKQLDLFASKYIRVTPLPAGMTLTKDPDLRVQERLTGFVRPTVSMDEGISRVLKNVKARL